MRMLAIETATEACSAALIDGSEIRQRFEHRPQQQAQLILPMIDELMREADLQVTQLDAIAFGSGPGSFTGLRIAAAVTQGIAMSADIPVIPVSTLAAIAQHTCRIDEQPAVLAAIDARMGEVYWGVYQRNSAGLMVSSESDCVSAPDSVPVPATGKWAGAGSGWRAYPDILTARCEDKLIEVYSDRWPVAEDVITLARPVFESGAMLLPEQAQPVYLRNKVARSKQERGLSS